MISTYTGRAKQKYLWKLPVVKENFIEKVVHVVYFEYYVVQVVHFLKCSIKTNTT